MKFALHSLRNGSECIWIYDTATSEVFDDQGRLQFAHYPSGDYKPVTPFTRELNPNKKGQTNNLLEISLGFNCNYECVYCSQNRLRGKAYSSKPSDVEPFIKQLKDSGINPTKIQLWGGEPLVYWKTCLLLIPELRTLYPDCYISIVTNGSLLDRAKVDFLAKYDIQLFISHDGPNNQQRTHDVLADEKVVDAVKYSFAKYGYGSVVFGTTLGKGNTDVIKVAKYFNDFFGCKDYQIQVGVHNVARCHDSKDLNQVLACKIPQEDLEIYSSTIFEALMSPHYNYYGCQSLCYRLDNAAETIINKEPITSVRAECCMPFSDGLLTDMKGNILTCHNHATQEYTCGHLSELDKVHGIGYNYWANKKRCRECPMIHFCKGGCPSADDRANELACPNLYALYLGIFRALFGKLFGIYVKTIERIGQ